MSKIKFKHPYDALFFLKVQVLLFTLSAVDIAGALGVSPMTISIWKNYKASVPSKYYSKIDSLIPEGMVDGIISLSEAMFNEGNK